ncbi:MAG: MBL fold metallo-hydrolase [Desulfatirhabdiaceae bacterium]
MTPLPNSSTLSVCILASGSQGNCIHVSNGSTAILVDAGLSGKEIEHRMAQRGLSPANLDAIVVSHEHTDHIQAVGILSRRFHLPVYMTSQTAVAAAPHLKNLDSTVSFECGHRFCINSLTIDPFSISHDAEEPSGFTIQHAGIKIGIATDLGIVTSLVKTCLADCRLLVLEANHDPDMLMNGPYPWPLKQRIRGRTGHLSNKDSCMLLRELRHAGLQDVILAHLSETNNTPEKAFSEVGNAIGDFRVRLTVSTQNVCGDIFTVSSQEP